jgi:hypothetical protein
MRTWHPPWWAPRLRCAGCSLRIATARWSTSPLTRPSVPSEVHCRTPQRRRRSKGSPGHLRGLRSTRDSSQRRSPRVDHHAALRGVSAQPRAEVGVPCCVRDGSPASVGTCAYSGGGRRNSCASAIRRSQLHQRSNPARRRAAGLYRVKTPTARSSIRLPANGAPHTPPGGPLSGNALAPGHLLACSVNEAAILAGTPS